jgi:3-hydroxyisobutyrate dehydrogenase-like beta-hydroxyacid dehydrogenase
MSPPLPSVGFVGLGDQGGPMASRILAAGFPLAHWARRPEALAVYDGARRATDLGDLARSCDIIGICVVDDAGVNEVFEGLLPGLRPGSLLMIHSTVHPDTCRALAARSAQMDVGVIDAPVSGGRAAAASGTLTVMCGGNASAIELARPVLDCFAGLVIRLGDVGAGQEAKLINNAIMTANLGVASAARNLARSLCVDIAGLDQIIAASSGRSFAHDVFARLGSPRDFARGARLLRKDVDLLAALADGDDDAGALVFHAANAFLHEAED